MIEVKDERAAGYMSQKGASLGMGRRWSPALYGVSHLID
jgi:hypothetical protein